MEGDADGRLPRSTVKCDAAWYSETYSPALIERIKQDRRSHVAKTLAQRQAGQVGVPLKLAPESATSSVPMELTDEQETGDGQSVR